MGKWKFDKQVPNRLTSYLHLRFEPSGGGALLLYLIYGHFMEDMEISGKMYRTAVLPPGFDLGMASFALTGLGGFVARFPQGVARRLALPWAIIFRAFSPCG